MQLPPSLQVVRLTPPGRGAVATLAVEGPDAAAVVARRFRPQSARPLDEHPPDAIVFGRFGDESAGEDGPAEEVVVRRHADDSVEIHCHGGTAVVARIERALVDEGAEVVAWRDCLAVDGGDPLEEFALDAAAHVALADARTVRTAAILSDQHHGALRREVRTIKHALTDGDVASARRRLEALLARARLGRRLVRPWRVVLAGRPNVGKSSLINALLGYDRAIVHHEPGTTRDLVTARTAIDGWPCELSDTAGLRTSDCEIEQAGVARAQDRLAEADLVVLVADLSQPWSDEQQRLLDATPECLLVHNKSDLPADPSPRPEGLPVSAERREGVDALLAAISERLVPDPPEPGAPVPFTEAQIERIAAWRAELDGGVSGG